MAASLTHSINISQLQEDELVTMQASANNSLEQCFYEPKTLKVDQSNG